MGTLFHSGNLDLRIKVNKKIFRIFASKHIMLMYLYGASGHAKVILDILKACNIKMEGLIDDNPSVNELMGFPVFHNRLDLHPVIVPIGNCDIRRKVVEKIAQTLNATPFDAAVFGTAIHPSAIISESAHIGVGTVVMQGAIIQTCAQIGRHCIVNTGAKIDHECVIGDYVHIDSGTTLSNNVTVGNDTWIGTGSIITQGIHIGNNVVVNAGSVVDKDIPDGCTAYGNPCQVRKTEI